MVLPMHLLMDCNAELGDAPTLRSGLTVWHLELSKLCNAKLGLRFSEQPGGGARSEPPLLNQ